MEILLKDILGISSTEFLYSVSVLLGATFIITWGLFKLKKAENKRLNSAEKMDLSDAVETDKGIDEDFENITRKRAISSIAARFQLIRKTFIPLVITFALFLILIPILPTMPASYITLIAGILAVLVGMAAKPLIENAIAGVVITLSQPIRLNDTVIIDGNYGTIEKINLLFTVVKIWNWRRFVIPNHKLLQKEFQNLSLGDEIEWAHIEFHVAPGSDLDKVKRLAKESMASKYLLTSEAPSFWVMNLEKDSIKCWVAGWAETPSDAWALRSAARKKLGQLLMENHIHHQLVRNEISGAQLSKP